MRTQKAPTREIRDVLHCRYFAFVLCLVSLHGDFSHRQYTVDRMLLPEGNPFKCHEEVLSLKPMIPRKRFDISPPVCGMLRRSKCVHIFL